MKVKKEFEIWSVSNPFHPSLPDLIIATLKKNGMTFQASGKGMTRDARVLSAYGEAVERFNIFNLKADIVAPYEDNKKYISPGFFYPDFFVDKSVVEWVKVKKVKAANTNSFYIHRPIRNSKLSKFYHHSSNGCAVGMSASDSKMRARNELLERHNFLSAWFFSNLEIVELNDYFKEDLIINEVGWEIFRFYIKNKENKGTNCTLMVNRFDKRFTKGGAIVGLSYGSSKKSILSSLAECLQALEVKLVSSEVELSLNYYLENAIGGNLLLSFFREKRNSNFNIKLGREYFCSFKSNFDIPFYTEYFIENSIPHRMYDNINLKILENFKSVLVNRKGMPVPIG